MLFNFWDIDWGPDEAKGDKNLNKYFVEIAEYKEILKGNYRYIVGRKGSGKTAILERVKIETEKDPMSFIGYLSLRNFPLQLLKSLRDKSMEDKSQYVPIWKFLILVELSRLIVSDQGISGQDIPHELALFLKENFPKETSFVDTLHTLQKNSGKIKVISNWFGGEYSKEQQEQTTALVYYQKVVDFLKHKIQNITTESSYYIFFDELDEGYSANDSGKRLLLLSLIRAIEDTYIELDETDSFSFRPLLALRSDIYDNLEDNDLNKLDDYLIRLRWTSGYAGGYPIKAIVNERIRAYMQDKYPELVDIITQQDLWLYIADDNSSPVSHIKLWNYICNRTFDRPRDIVKFFKYCRKEQGSGKLSGEIVGKAELKFSKWFYDEFRDEVHSFLPIWKEVLSCITSLGYGKTNTNELSLLFESNKTIKVWLESHSKDTIDILKILYDYSVIGNLDSGNRWLFKYKDDDMEFDQNKDIIIHYGFHKKLRLKKRRQEE